MSKLIAHYFKNVYDPISNILTGELEIEPSPSDVHYAYAGEDFYIGIVQAKGRMESGIKVEIMEEIEYDGDNITKTGYSYQACDPDGITIDEIEKDPKDATILRYDNAPHHERIETHPDHKHVGVKIRANYTPILASFIDEVIQLTDGKTITFKNEQ